MRSLLNKNILVTGGAGFIGSHLTDNLSKIPVANLIVIDNLFIGLKENLNLVKNFKSFKFFNDDATDLNILSYLIKKFQIDIVFNCATKPLNYSFINPKKAFDVNTKIALNLLELQREKLFSTLCHFSTSEVYGTSQGQFMKEDHPLNPITPYAAGKLSADMAILSYHKTFDLDAFIVRPFNNFGPRQNPLQPLAGIIPLTITRILDNRPPIIHGDGSQSRDFIFVEDTIDNITNIFSVINKGDVVNVASNNEITVIDLIKKISDKMGYKGDFKFLKKRDADVVRHRGSSARLKKLIKQKITNFDNALIKTIKWYSRKYKNV